MSAQQQGAIFDPGMQPERTALAWRRTALSMAVGSLAAFRIFPGVLGPVAFVPAALAFAVAVTVLVAAHLRYRRVHERLMAEPERRIARPALPGGGLVAITAAATLGLGLCAVLVFVTR